ncbi:MAG: DMT family transporter [Cardiobacteriaceae bacterium]|nr:DMT family transporter [Cardiobacteriaceae bacterium]
MPGATPSISAGIFWALLATINFAVMGIVIKETDRLFPFHSSELAFWRTLLTVIVLGLLALARRRRFATPHIGRHLSRSIAGTISLILFFYAITSLPLATAITLSYTSSIFLALLSFIVLGERIAPITAIALLLGLVGVAVILKPGVAEGQEWGLFSALASGALAGWAYLQVREMTRIGEPAWRIVFYFALICTLTCALIVSVQGWHFPEMRAIPYLFAIGATALVAQLSLTRAYAVGPKFTVAAMNYLTVIFSAVMAHYFFHEHLGVQEFIGMSIIVAGGILSALPPRPTKES